MLIWILAVLSVIGVVLFAALTSFFLATRRVLLPAAAPAAAPLLSVIVPARNEAANIERCVRSLLAQDYPSLEIIAVDDASTDDTPAILARLGAEDARLHPIAGRPLRPGWTGKCNAVDRGVGEARGAWLLFVDADMVLHPGAISAAYATASREGVTLLTLWARQELATFWERVVQPVIIGFNIVSDPFQRVNSSKHPTFAIANGQFLLVERAAYERVGGHAAVRDEVVEDQQLACHFKGAGERILMMDGSDMLQTRMYTSLHGIWEGWSKNNFLTFDRNMALMLAAAISVYFVAVNPFLMLFVTLVALKFNHHFSDPLLLNLLSIAGLLWVRWRTRTFCRTPARDYLLHGLGAIIFIGIFFNSAYRHTSGQGVTWKGRRYSDADSAA